MNLYCGLSIEHKCGKELHPLTNVQRGVEYVKNGADMYSNSPDLVMMMVEVCKNRNIHLNIYLDGVISDIETVFNDFNRSYDIIDTEYFKNNKNGQ